jgi:hypothetical protein
MLEWAVGDEMAPERGQVIAEVPNWTQGYASSSYDGTAVPELASPPCSTVQMMAEMVATAVSSSDMVADSALCQDCNDAAVVRHSHSRTELNPGQAANKCSFRCMALRMSVRRWLMLLRRGLSHHWSSYSAE